MNLDRLVAEAETFHEELGRESYLTGAGLKATPEFQAIYDSHAGLLGDDALEAARTSRSPALYEWAVDIRVGRAVASFEERQLVWEGQAVVRADGREIAYLRVPIELVNTADRSRRTRLDRARAATVAVALNGLRRDRFLAERDVVFALGFSDYPQAVASLAGIDVDALGRDARQFLDASRDLYRDNLRLLVRRRLGIPLERLVRADAGWLFRADRFDAAFPPDRLIETAATQLGEMHLDSRQGGRVRFDTDERAAKQPRAFCVPVRVPEEVYLVLRPRGGHSDYRTFWHELGHAMHFASVDPKLPFAARWLGDNSVTEGFAMLYDHLTLSEPWLRRYAGLTRDDARSLVFELGLSELFLVRRYAAKLLYELELHRSAYQSDLAPRYTELLTEATLFRYLDDDHLVDVDPGFYAARYLRAWQMEAALSRVLTQRYDVEWFRQPDAGTLLQELMRRGQADPAERLLGATVDARLDFDGVVQRVASYVE